MHEVATTTRGSRAAFRFCAALAAAFALAAPTAAPAQDMMQLNVPAAEYSLGRFKYVPPKVDGWRQIANMKDALSLVYAEQLPDEKIETKFGVAFEAHDIPEENRAAISGAAQLAEMSRAQITEQRKADVVSQDPITQVGNNPNLFTYRLLVHSLMQGEPDTYEVYYVMIAPDKAQYLVVQCITKTPNYQNEVYWAQFFGSLTSLRYDPNAAPTAEPARKADDPAAPAGDSGKPGGTGVEIAPDGSTTAPKH
jgi:hypothetical protein